MADWRAGACKTACCPSSAVAAGLLLYTGELLWFAFRFAFSFVFGLQVVRPLNTDSVCHQCPVCTEHWRHY